MYPIEKMKENTFTNFSYKDGKPVKEIYTLGESQLEKKHLDILTGELMNKWQNSPIEVQRRFLNRRLTRGEVLDYEIRSHWLASWISFKWGQDLLASYFVWKVKRKYKRYRQSNEMEEKARTWGKQLKN